MEESPLPHFSIVFLVSISIIAMLAPMLPGSYNLVAQEEVNQQQLQPLSIYDIFNKVEDSVVQITTSVPPSTIPNPDRQQENQTALGSGFVYDESGHIVTNNHVVANARIVDITFIDGNRYTANVTGRDVYSDLAVLKIVENFTQAELAPPLTLGNSSELKVGDQVVAIGNPFGLEGSITTGIVSQTGRLLPLEETGFSVPNGSITNQYGERLGGDIITAVDGNPVVRMEDLISYLETKKSVDQNMTLTVYRDGKTIDKQITIGQRPSPVPFLTRAPQPPP